MKKVLKKIWKKEDGSATVEFAILFPAIMTIFFSSFEVAVWLTREVLLDRALDLNVRLLRLGVPLTQDELQAKVCQDSLIFQNCPKAVRIELTRVSTQAWNLPHNSKIACVNRNEDVQVPVDFEPGAINDLMIVRACAVLEPFFGTTPLVMGLPRDPSGGSVVAAASSFVNEP